MQILTKLTYDLSVQPLSPDRPLIGLAMIVRNEVHGIVETLASFKPHIDRWTILDTGSTDGTQAAIKQTLDGVPGQLFEEPFVDFATSRNRALDLHGDATVFVVMPDSDDRLIQGERLRNFCEQRRSPTSPADNAYLLNLRRGELSYFLPLIMRTGVNWRYKGRVHEFSGCPEGIPAAQCVPDAQLVQTPKPQSREASRRRWERDLELLRADQDAAPKDPRTAFYLAQTYECLGMCEEALAAYQRRIELGGWMEETFEAKLRLARVLDALQRPWAEILEAYLSAHTFDPRRAEPLYQVAKHYYEHDEHALVYLFASAADRLPPPNVKLFVDAEVYEWRAADLCAISGYYLSRQLGDVTVRATSAAAAAKAVRACPQDERLRKNLAYYTEVQL